MIRSNPYLSLVKLEYVHGKSSANPEALGQVRNVLRLHHYSIHTDADCGIWIGDFGFWIEGRAGDDAVAAAPQAHPGRWVTEFSLRAPVQFSTHPPPFVSPAALAWINVD
jgi:hypothetical protein